jgi:hypothetical protein
LIVARVITYKAGRYCQLKLNSGERILISCARTGIKIMNLGWGGLFPKATLAHWPIDKTDDAITVFLDIDSPSAHPLDAIVKKLSTCASIRDVRRITGTGHPRDQR